MTLKQISQTAGVKIETARVHAKKLFPFKFQNGKLTDFDKAESEQIMEGLKKKNFVQPLSNLPDMGEVIKAILEPILKQQNDFNLRLLQEVKSIKTESKQIELKQDYYSILGYCNLKKIEMTFSDAIKHGKEAAKLSKEKAIEIRRIPDERFGTVGSYSIDILNEIFKI